MKLRLSHPLKQSLPPQKAIISAIAGVALSLCGTAYASQYYKWVDKQGVTHYSATPPAKGKGKPVKIHTGTGMTVAAEKTPAAPEANTSAAKEPKVDTNALADKLNEEARIKLCEDSRKNYKILMQNARIRMVQEDGETRVIGEEERQQQIKNAEKTIKETCSA